MFVTRVNTTSNDKIWLLTFDKTRPKIWCFKFSCGSSDHDGHDDHHNYDQDDDHDDDRFLKVVIQWARQALQCVLGTLGKYGTDDDRKKLINWEINFSPSFINSSIHNGAREEIHTGRLFFRSHKLAASGNDTHLIAGWKVFLIGRWAGATSILWHLGLFGRQKI